MTLGKVVVNRSVSVDGFIAGPVFKRRWAGGKSPDQWIPRETIVEIASETGAMLFGRGTSDFGDQLEAEEAGSVNYPFDGALFLLTHRPPDPPVEGLTVLSGDIREAVATALAAANGRNLELLGANVAAQAFRAGLVDEVLIYVLPVVLGEGVPFSPPGSAMVNLELYESRRVGDVTLMRFRVVK
ncbi:MAG TPA: dihydrofolate reductase family protein [Candidatus Limnocylindrales bacterium]|nr:dihydrofolate reductase family protein [Candidatus Limnocylindrales bacterium]